MTLRQGVTFHNGMPMTAEDVRVSLERSAASAQMDPVTGMIDRVTVIDDYNFTVHTTVPFAPILAHLAHPGASIVPAALVDAGHDFSVEPIGSGPFRFIELNVGESVILERFDDYWRGATTLDGLELVLVGDTDVRAIEVAAGNAHIGLDLQPTTIAANAGTTDFNLMRRMNLAFDYVGFNTQMPPFDNVLVRQAISYAVDVADLFNTAFHGVGEPARGYIAPAVFGFYEAEMFTQDFARARELLTEAGYPDGFNATIWYNVPNTARQDIAERLAFMVSQIGINLEVQGLEWASYLDRTGNVTAEHDIFIMGWVALTGDADYGIRPVLHSEQHGAAGNRTFFSHPEVDRLLDAGRAEVDPAARLDLYAQAQRLLRDYAPMIPIRHGEFGMAVGHGVNGFIISPLGHHTFSRVSIG
jgi:peptide/nickel transport system substrate-binding protein